MSIPLPRYIAPCVAVALLALLPAACKTVKPTKSRQQDITLYDFNSAIRWGDWDKAYDFVDPKTKKEHPLSDVEKSRFKQIEVSGYQILSRLDVADAIDQQVELGLINRNTQQPRTIVYHEHWRWDAEANKWWLTTGLPDISPRE